jgi:hypothetical protein
VSRSLYSNKEDIGMSENSIQRSALTEAALALYDEGYLGPPEPKGTWFTDNEPNCGLLGTIESLSAARASEPLSGGDPLTLASHVDHVRFALNLANRAAKGEHPYKDAKWARSWDTRKVGDAEWVALVGALRKEYADFRLVLAAGKAWDDPQFLTGALGLIAHGAWHLGAIRQALGLVKAPAD